MMPPIVLSVAGVDSGGGAGVVADAKTLTAHGAWATCAVTAVTAQNTVGVQRVDVMPPDAVEAQIAAVCSDLRVDAVKTGMLGSAENAEVVAAAVRRFGLRNLVVDPVLVAKDGTALLAPEAVDRFRDALLPLATVVAPNLPELERLVGRAVGDRAAMEEAGRSLLDAGPAVVMVKGGHLDDPAASPDCVVVRGQPAVWLEGRRLATADTHGTGCVLSAAIAAELARGMAPADACIAAKHFVEGAIEAGLSLGRGVGPVDPDWARRPS